MTDLIGVDAEPDNAAELAARHGFEGLDLRLNKYDDWLSAYGIDRFANLMGELGLLSGYTSIMSRTLSVGDEEWRQAIDNLPRRARIAESLGFTRAGVVVLPFDDERDAAANHRRHVRRLREAAPILADHGIHLGLEYIGPKTRREGHTHPFIHTMKGMLHLIDDAGHANIGLMLDTLHWHCATETSEDIEALDHQQVVVVHLCDGLPDRSNDEQTVTERLLPRESGVFDNDTFVGAIRKIGYSGPMTAEPTSQRWQSMEADEAVSMTAAAVRKTLGLDPIPLPQQQT
ncbi:sugar phosphate isomerase/epimerase family protein [Mucisphaera sp.]|uniref:sugar phosphate isomerase/epimerase family protein n=1 Tax=Mucisphaera sp. TaxID=2913024 RepID=UPI003D114620